MTNPLLRTETLPAFDLIQAKDIIPAVEETLEAQRAALAKLLEKTDYSWDSLIEPLERLEENLSRVWSPVGHLNMVMNSDELREAHDACLPKLSDFHTEVAQNQQLYAAIQSIRDSAEFESLDSTQQKLIDDSLRDFKLSGVTLADEQKARYKAIAQRLSTLTSEFSNNVLDATNAWQHPVTEESELDGIPDSSKAMLKQFAEQAQQPGWLVNLQMPSYIAVMTYAANRALRETVYRAYTTRASELGPSEQDNSPLMDEILALRHEKAQLLGFNNYAELSLATKMADSSQQVEDFLLDLADKSKDQAQADYEEVQAFAAEQGATELAAWDISYWSEKLRQAKYAISDEDLRPYFPAEKVFEGLFNVAQRLFDVRIEATEFAHHYRDDIRFFSIYDADGSLRGQFFLDCYARQHKRGGAWMDVCRSRVVQAQQTDVPVAYLVCNATPPVGDKPALLTHDEVVTLFHEFGHGLHHMLTQVNVTGLAGISGVEWDAVELPSQFLENWAWEKEALDSFAQHWETGEPLPQELFEKMTAAKNFQSGLMMLRQIEFALFDMRIHGGASSGPSNDNSFVAEQLAKTRAQVAVIQPPEFNRFQHSFSHIFAGGYAAGYFSYKWAEVLSADAFSAFEESAVFDRDTGQRFKQEVLEMGGARTAAENFKAFRGREPQIEPLLRHSGIAA
jgi:oligopeptidase A